MSVPRPLATEPVPGDATTVPESTFLLRRDVRYKGPPASLQDAAPYLPRWTELDPPTLASAEGTAAIRDAWQAFTIALHRHFPGGRPLRAPGATGFECLLRSLPAGVRGAASPSYIRAPADVRGLVADTSPQHRMEVLQPGRRVSRVLVYDARVQYLACCERLPVLHRPSDLIRDTGTTLDPKRRGRYLIDATVPAGWAHPGLLHAPGTGRDPRLGRHYPNRPGTTWQTWADDGDLRLLDAHEWPYVIRERLLFAPDGPGDRPLRQWAAQLRRMIEAADAHRATSPGLVADVYRALVRNSALMPLGMLAMRRYWDDVEYLTDDDVPDSLPPGAQLTREADGRWKVSTPRELHGGFQARWGHPEWASAIWATARRRTLKLALLAPPGALLAIDGDAVYLADVDPEHPTLAGWADTGTVGCYRLQTDVSWPRPVRVPDQGHPYLLRELVKTRTGDAS